MSDETVVIIDLKGDSVLFAAMRAQCDAAGRTFKGFTNDLAKPCVFNPLVRVEALEEPGSDAEEGERDAT